MFFDIKPNGDLWICQDQPSRMPLNILDPDFLPKFHSVDTGQRRTCSGCTYSCYVVTQKGLEPRNWPDVAGLWWKSNTRPGERCRRVAQNCRWAAGLLLFCADRLAPALRTTMQSAAGLLLLAALLFGQPVPTLAPDQVLADMEAANTERRQKLASLEGVRRYEAGNLRFNRHATMLARYRFTAPDQRTFEVTERQGSRLVQSRAIEPAMAAERSNRTGGDTEISRRNYNLKLLRFDEAKRAWIFEVEPRGRNKYIFRGKVWIDERTFAIARIEGEPAQSPSFWVKRTHFVHEHAPFGEFCFPVRHRSEAELRLFGKSVLTIEYFDYHWRSRQEIQSGAP